MTVGIYQLKVNDRSTRTKFGFVGFIANFEHISHLCSSVSIANFEHVIAGWVLTIIGQSFIGISQIHRKIFSVIDSKELPVT